MQLPEIWTSPCLFSIIIYIGTFEISKRNHQRENCDDADDELRVEEHENGVVQGDHPRFGLVALLVSSVFLNSFSLFLSFK